MIHVEAALLQKLDGTLNGLRSALQSAIELEHSTIPPYLYALYSIKPGTNSEIASLIFSVVIEEMLHMALACNLLNSVGGEPEIDRQSFIPAYPGPMPGSVKSGLIVNLSPLSMNLVQNTFMCIEEPESPLVFPDRALLTPQEEPVTIGQFYRKISNTIVELSTQDNIFTGDLARQLVRWAPPIDDIAVTDEKSALTAIETIVEQGEGTNTSPLDPEHELAHFYRYSEILHGRRLVPQAEPPGFAYAGETIVFDPSGVWPAITNPGLKGYPPETTAANLNDTFNFTYTSLLKVLHQVFNGAPGKLGAAIALMESLKTQAYDLMATPISPKIHAGPTFHWKPVL